MSSHCAGQSSELRLAHQRGDRRQRVHGEHDAQDRAQVAEVRQRGSDGVLSYNRPHIRKPACKHRAGRARRVANSPRLQRLLSATRRRRGKPTSASRPFAGRRCPSAVSLRFASRPRNPPPWPTRSRRTTPRARRLVRPLRRARRRARQALSRRRSTSIAGSPPSTSPARSRTRGCWPRSACSPPTISRRSSAAWRRSAARSSAANSPGRATSRTSTSTSRSG